jgi:A/G-specific adenine glycosylase
MEKFEFQRILTPLLCWYRANKRDLPWRENPTPYHVCVSEIMLQQTRVEAVKEYYARFISALPTVEDLATCEEEKLLKLWEGLGYYSRARNLQKLAKTLVNEYDGIFPDDVERLKTLSGVGSYTAGAIASIAFGKREPAVDGNVLRVVSRLTTNPTPISDTKYRKYLERALKEIYPPEGDDCSAFTQSLFELGALVCKPQNPDCEACPLKSICESYRHGTQGEYPVLPEKKVKRREQVCVLVVSTPDGIAINKRTAGVLKGMNEFPSFVGKTLEESAKELKIERFELIKSKKYTHIFTHIVWEMAAYLIKTEKVGLPCYSRSEIEEKVSLPTAFKQCLSILDGETGANE